MSRVRQRGIVLVLVLWTLVLLMTIVSAVSSSVHTESTLAHRQLDQARSRALAEAAFHYAAARAFDPDSEMAWEADGQPHGWRFDGVEMVIRLQKEQERLDLNGATAQQLDRLLQFVEVDDEVRDGLVDAILDWRDSDSLHRLNGAEDEAYRLAGMPYGAKDAPFTTPDEIGLVLGMTPQLQERLMPHLTLTVSRGSGLKPSRVLPGGFGMDAGNHAQMTGIRVLVEIPGEQSPFLAEAVVTRSKDRLRFITVNYAVSPTAWPVFEED
ncbi:MAG: general secretion pathway protein GspK [Candidatus Thiodiazotropha sp. (ex Epidulcina cf. delphinae)]|nr:general secretion pathway protein GspK [Candidatus Thiodiazotropha sp. (ex Epidulcina cf. delphinae)]